jgi:hypothetical protein
MNIELPVFFWRMLHKRAESWSSSSGICSATLKKTRKMKEKDQQLIHEAQLKSLSFLSFPFFFFF